MKLVVIEEPKTIKLEVDWDDADAKMTAAMKMAKVIGMLEIAKDAFLRGGVSGVEMSHVDRQ